MCVASLGTRRRSRPCETEGRRPPRLGEGGRKGRLGRPDGCWGSPGDGRPFPLLVRWRARAERLLMVPEKILELSLLVICPVLGCLPNLLWAPRLQS